MYVHTKWMELGIKVNWARNQGEWSKESRLYVCAVCQDSSRLGSNTAWLDVNCREQHMRESTLPAMHTTCHAHYSKADHTVPNIGNIQTLWNTQYMNSTHDHTLSRTHARTHARMHTQHSTHHICTYTLHTCTQRYIRTYIIYVI